CCINDIVLTILGLLRYHQRALYVEIDTRHSDRIKEASYIIDRVTTASFHLTGFLLGIGKLEETGVGKGKNHAINAPLKK
ncbi:hypothetical protein BCR41DRAFT_295493, partial [Lobosporangium transversale]